MSGPQGKESNAEMIARIANHHRAANSQSGANVGGAGGPSASSTSPASYVFKGTGPTGADWGSSERLLDQPASSLMPTRRHNNNVTADRRKEEYESMLRNHGLFCTVEENRIKELMKEYRRQRSKRARDTRRQVQGSKGDFHGSGSDAKSAPEHPGELTDSMVKFASCTNSSQLAAAQESDRPDTVYAGTKVFLWLDPGADSGDGAGGSLCTAIISDGAGYPMADPSKWMLQQEVRSTTRIAPFVTTQDSLMRQEAGFITGYNTFKLSEGDVTMSEDGSALRFQIRPHGDKHEVVVERKSFATRDPLPRFLSAITIRNPFPCVPASTDLPKENPIDGGPAIFTKGSVLLSTDAVAEWRMLPSTVHVPKTDDGWDHTASLYDPRRFTLLSLDGNLLKD